MINFNNDYGELATREILDRIEQLSDRSFEGYGLDTECESARQKVKQAIGREDIDVHFLIGGTQANEIMISQMLRPHECVICASSGHINMHETGAIESTGHKVEPVPSHGGKIDPAEVEALVLSREDEHMVKPKAVYISDSTELGTVYTKAELQQIRAVCDKYGLYLYLDGARLGVALTCEENDLTLHDIADLCDCFYIGATKNGGMIGEAMVICNDELKPDFRYMMKHHGGLLAKGFLLGIQFDTLFSDDLFFRLGRHSNEMAELLRKGLKELKIRSFVESPTNQTFVYLPNNIIDKLLEKYSFLIWEKGREESVVRLVTSWFTKAETVEEFITDIKKAAAID